MEYVLTERFCQDSVLRSILVTEELMVEDVTILIGELLVIMTILSEYKDTFY